MPYGNDREIEVIVGLLASKKRDFDAKEAKGKLDEICKKISTQNWKQDRFNDAEEFHTKPRKKGTIAQITALKFGKDK